MRVEEEVAYYMKRVYDRGLTTSQGGNISMRVGSIMYITPSSLDKACLQADDIAKVDISTGENLTPELKLSIESEMHRYIYKKRYGAKAVIHAHAPLSSFFSSSQREIMCDIIQESYYQIRGAKKVPFAIMGSKELAENVSNASIASNALLLEKHGVLTISNHSLINALEILECLENAAKMTILSGFYTVDRLTEEQKLLIENF